MKRSVKAGGATIDYTLVQSVRQDVLMKVLPERGLWIYAPKWMRLKDVDALVCERAAQVLEMQRQVDARLAKDRAAHPLRDGCGIRVEGRMVALRLREGARVRGEAAGDEYRLTLPPPHDDDAVRAALRAALSALALRRVRERISYYAPRIGRQPGRIAIRAQKTRWGSCSAKGNLNFNWKLIMAPPQCLDYVVIHELCHLWEFNHSPRFWARVSQQMPEYDAWRKWLKQHAAELEL